MEKLFLKSPIGVIGVEHQEGCLSKIEFRIKAPTKKAKLSSDSKKLEVSLKKYFKSPNSDFCVPFEIQGTDFEKAVYLELWKTRPGETLSYKDLAKRVGRPKAFRAVAQTMAKNKLPLLIPCHRVINTNGKLGGFSGGLSTKKWLLAHERRVLDSSK